MALAPGTRLGPYEILSPLGAGGMGEVYRARDTRLARDVAVKVLPEATASDPAALARFEKEAKAVASLSHPNILAIHDFGTEGGITYAVTELLEGETLRRRLDLGAIPPRRAAEIARGIALGLSAAHDKGIAHRDLKPENLFLTRDGSVKILDFGLARQIRKPQAASDGTLTDHTVPGAFVGTAGYMSPEQVRGEPVDHRTDIFSFGAVLYEMLSGKRAFKGDSLVETMNTVLREDPPPLSGTNKPVPPALDRLVWHCLEKLPADRFQSARDLAFDLAGISTESSASGRALPARSRWPRRLIRAAAAAGIGVLGLWAGARYGPGRPITEAPTIRRLTFRRGAVHSARFAPDGKTVVYSAAFEGRPPELFSVRTDTVESRPLGIENADLASVSPTGELALLLHPPGPVREWGAPKAAILARVPLGGGAPRQLLENTFDASWGPGEELAAIIRAEKGMRLEYPLGHVVLPDAFEIDGVRVSPDGRFVASLVKELEKGARLLISDRSGGNRALPAPAIVLGFAWSHSSDEIFYVGGPTNDRLTLSSMDLSGRARILMPIMGATTGLEDVSEDGRFLLHRFTGRGGMACRSPGEEKEREIGWLHASKVRAISKDGKTVLFTEFLEGSPSRREAFLRPCDGSPAVRLGEGIPQDLSTDGKWVAVRKRDSRELSLLPTAAGHARAMGATRVRPDDVRFSPDGRSLTAIQLEDAEVLRERIPLDGGPSEVRKISYYYPAGEAESPDGSAFAFATKERKLMKLSASGAQSELPGPPLEPGDEILQWSADGGHLFIARRAGPEARILRRDIATGTTEAWLALRAPGVPAAVEIGTIYLTPDGRSYAYDYSAIDNSDFFLVEGLK